MRFPIDAVFLDRELKALRVVSGIKPWRLSPWVPGAHSVLELAGGCAAPAVQEGDLLEFR